MRLGPFGIWELLVILLIVFLFFGAKRLPGIAKGVGESVREFRREIRNVKADIASDEPAADARRLNGDAEPTSSATAREAKST